MIEGLHHYVLTHDGLWIDGVEMKKIEPEDIAIHFDDVWHRRVPVPSIGGPAFAKKVKCGKTEKVGPSISGPFELDGTVCAGCWS